MVILKLWQHSPEEFTWFDDSWNSSTDITRSYRHSPFFLTGMTPCKRDSLYGFRFSLQFMVKKFFLNAKQGMLWQTASIALKRGFKPVVGSRVAPGRQSEEKINFPDWILAVEKVSVYQLTVPTVIQEISWGSLKRWLYTNHVFWVWAAIRAFLVCRCRGTLVLTILHSGLCTTSGWSHFQKHPLV